MPEPIREWCPECERDTEHEVSLEVREERTGDKYSNEPYRVSECTECGLSNSTRMNNA